MIGDHVVDKRRAHRARKSEIADLYGSCTAREYVWTAILRVTRQIDSDVDFQCTRPRHNLGIGHRGDIVKLIEGRREPPAHRIIARASEGKPDHLESVAVMSLEQAGRQRRDRVVAKVRREITDAQFFARRICGHGGSTCGIPCRCPYLRSFALIGQ